MSFMQKDIGLAFHMGLGDKIEEDKNEKNGRQEKEKKMEEKVNEEEENEREEILQIIQNVSFE